MVFFYCDPAGLGHTVLSENNLQSRLCLHEIGGLKSLPSYNVCLVPTVPLSECSSHGEVQLSVWFPPSANTQSGRWELRKAEPESWI